MSNYANKKENEFDLAMKLSSEHSSHDKNMLIIPGDAEPEEVEQLLEEYGRIEMD